MKIVTLSTNTINVQKRNILQTLLLSVVVICSFFSYKNLLRGMYTIAYIELSLVFISLCCYVCIKRTNDYRKFLIVSLVFLGLVYLLMLYVVFSPNTSATNFLWFLIIPSASYAILNKTIGFIVSLFFGITSVLMYQYSTDYSDFAFYNMVACLLLSWYIIHVYERGNLASLAELENLSSRDMLTGLYNRKILSDIYQKHEHESALTNIIIDIDFFKNVNDEYGHDAGDKVLIFFADKLKAHFDEIGYVIRIGGEEFCVILPKIDIDDAHKLCEECLLAIRHALFMYESNNISLTFSAGVSVYPQEGDNYSEILKVADNRLYQAKNKGRNCIVSVE